LGKGLYEKKINLGPGYRLYLAQLGEVWLYF
jgi:putative component of toxin-antitoxin plasmid stabilization module